ncbi:MAG: hypothetical protein ISS79_05825 [Phycisphaerae bacterium]|nr:hypothetical protein [Phycisphaerae bacterium]
MNNDKATTRTEPVQAERRAGSMNRREFLAITAVGTAGAVMPGGGLTVMAGPFEESDYLKLIPVDKKLDANWVASLFAKGKPKVYRGDDLRRIGMPVGGICAGQIYLGGDGKLWLWDIFNKVTRGVADKGTNGENYVKPLEQTSPVDQGFAVRLRTKNKTVTTRLDIAGFEEVSFRGEYPVAFVTYRDEALPIDVSLKAYSPFIPLDTENSSLPATVMEFTVANTSDEQIEVEFAGWLQNAVCLHSGEPGQVLRRNRIVRSPGMTFLNCTAEKAREKEVEPKRPDIVFENFEKPTYEGWTVTGTAFGPGPILKSKMPDYQDVGAIQGKRLVNSHNVRSGEDVRAGDAHKGTLTSKTFTIERKYINFLIGGGGHKGKTCVNLLIDGKVVRTATGKNNNRVGAGYWEVSEFEGKKAQIQVVDDYSEGWGNIGLDEIVFSDKPRKAKDPLPMEQRGDFGTMGLALLGQSCGIARAELPGEGMLKSLFGDSMRTTDASKAFGQKLRGGLGRTMKLKPGGEQTVRFVITWHFPNLRLSNFGAKDLGRYYAARFGSAREVAGYVAENFERLSGLTELWRKTWYDSTLPVWFLDRTFANTSTLATSTVHRFGDGRFYGWEGIGCCAGTCTHVWHYAQAVARIFPELERDLRERTDFQIAFNEQNGAVGHRGEFARGAADDGQAGVILRSFREHQMTPNNEFLKRNWPRIKMATDYLIRKDSNDDGMIEGAQPNTLDAAWYGKIAWLNSLYLAALRAGEQMAIEMGDDDFAKKTRAIYEKGRKKIVELLWNGEYFIQIPDPKHLDAIGADTGCYIDQVFGQSWAFQVGLGRLYSAEHIKKALKSLWKYNFAPDVGPFKEIYKRGRPYALAGDGGLIMCSWPKGGKREGWKKHWQFMYFNECMTGFEYQVAAHMIREGMLKEALAITRAIHDRYDAALRNPYNEIECSDHYARAMASFGVYLAACGYEYHGPKGILGFAPKLSPENFTAAFTAAEGWGTFSQKRDSNTQIERIEIKYGTLRLTRLRFEIAEGIEPGKVTALLDNRRIAVGFDFEAGQVTIDLRQEIKIGAGSGLTIEII